VGVTLALIAWQVLVYAATAIVLWSAAM